MLVFTEEFVQQLKRRYEVSTVNQKPALYYAATLPENFQIRSEIEEWLVNLPLNSQDNLIRTLQAPEHFVQTYHELAIYNSLKLLGYVVEPASIKNLTPDWYVQPTTEIPAFIVEVFTSNPPAIWEADQAERQALFRRLKKLDFSVDLRIEFDLTVMPLNSKRSKEITKRIKEWLKENPSVDSILYLDGIVVTLIERDTDSSFVRLVFGTPSPPVPLDTLRRSFQEKAQKYNNLVKENNLPLVVCVTAGLWTNLQLKDFEDAILGEKLFCAFRDENGNTVAGPGWIRKSNGIFKCNPALSAAIWLWKEHNHWNIQPYHNPDARIPLPSNTFENR